MRRLSQLVLTLAVAFVGFTVLGVCRAADPSAITRPTEKAPLIVAIEQADSPSGAITAFNKALAGGQDERATYTAFVHRMAQLGLPQAAYDQAQTAVRLDPSDGVSWAVIAFTQADAGKAEEALSALAKAVPLAEDDPFVIRTAGQLLAWYDSTPGLTVPEETRKALEDIRRRLAYENLFDETYRTTNETFQRYNESGAYKGSVFSSPGVGEPAQAEPYTPPVTVETPTTIVYTQPNVVYYAYPYGFSYTTFCSPFIGWPGFSTVFVNVVHKHQGLYFRHDGIIHRHRTVDKPIIIHGGKVEAVPATPDKGHDVPKDRIRQRSMQSRPDGNQTPHTPGRAARSGGGGTKVHGGQTRVSRESR